jgi:hypothetical protein
MGVVKNFSLQHRNGRQAISYMKNGLWGDRMAVRDVLLVLRCLAGLDARNIMQVMSGCEVRLSFKSARVLVVLHCNPTNRSYTSLM